MSHRRLPKVPGREPYAGAAAVLLAESGCTVRNWRGGMTGVAALRSAEWAIEAPEPRGPVSFGVLAHEVGHFMLHRGARRPRWIEETEAEEYALAAFERFGLPGRDRYERNAARHLGHAYLKAIRRSPTLEARIRETFPAWVARAEEIEARALLDPSMSAERRALDVAP